MVAPKGQGMMAATKAPSRFGPRGRSTTPEARAAVAALLAGGPALRRELLVEHLHVLQDAEGCLREGHLVALAEMLRVAPVEVFETASFYAHFDILPDDAPAPPAITLRVCDGLPCAMAGAAALLTALRAAPPAGARVVAAPCMGACHRAPACAVGHDLVEHATPQTVAAAIGGGPAMPEPPRLAGYRARGGYAVLRAARDGVLTAEAMTAAVAAAGLRGLGGAGFPVARKWRLVLANPQPRHLVVNADEGEPGTFKDRHCLETDPHRVLEGMLLAAMAVGAEACWFYLRDEYPWLRHMLEREVAALEAAGLRRCRCICGAAPAPISAARRRRCWKASKAAAAIRATSRPSRPERACSAGRR